MLLRLEGKEQAKQRHLIEGHRRHQQSVAHALSECRRLVDEFDESPLGRTDAAGAAVKG